MDTQPLALPALALSLAVLAGCAHDNSSTTDTPSDNSSSASESSAAFYEQKGWELVFADEFDGSTLDRTKWSPEVNCWGGGNNELQCYTDRDENAFVADGVLHIRALREAYTGPVYNPDHGDYNPNDTRTQPWTSARLRTVSPMAYVAGQPQAFNFRHDWQYGRFEIRAKLPAGQGTWPAIWMLPTDWAYGGWAASGEIDIMEAVNLKADRVLESGEVVPENRVHGTLHYGRAWPNNVYSGVEYDFGDITVNPADDFHTYAVEWEAGEIRWYVDGVHYATQTQAGWYTHYQDADGNWHSSGDTPAPFNQPFHLILNLAIGGAWPANVNEKGVDDALQSAEMLVDYVRVYRCTADASGKTCGTRGEEGTYTLEPGKTEPPLPEDVPTNGTTLTLLNSAGLGTGFAAVVTWDGGDGGDTVSVDENGVMQAAFTGMGNASLQPASKLDMTDYASGTLHFELAVDSMGTASDIAVKMDSGWPNVAPIELSTLSAGLPAAGAGFVSYDIPVADFVAANAAFDLSQIVNAVVVEAVNGGDLQVQLRNVYFTR